MVHKLVFHAKDQQMHKKKNQFLIRFHAKETYLRKISPQGLLSCSSGAFGSNAHQQSSNLTFTLKHRQMVFKVCTQIEFRTCTSLVYAEEDCVKAPDQLLNGSLVKVRSEPSCSHI